jgi:hypothetical protein
MQDQEPTGKPAKVDSNEAVVAEATYVVSASTRHHLAKQRAYHFMLYNETSVMPKLILVTHLQAIGPVIEPVQPMVRPRGQGGWGMISRGANG